MLTQWVIKVSKFCNLRCDYCYELPELGDRARMSVEQVAALFDNMADFYEGTDAGLCFVWHGGEPLLQKPDYFRAILAEQRRRLSGREVRNYVQTNLTVLDDDRIAWLRELDGIGVSLDLFGDHRLSLGGRSSQERVLRNLDRLHAEKIRFGCITVLTRRTLPYIDDIFRFYEATNLSFRILPLFKAASDDQNAGFQVTGQEVLEALCRLFDLWLASPTRIDISPLGGLLKGLVGRRAGEPPDYYDRRTWEEVVVVNTNGDLYADADAYIPGRSWGNAFAAPLRTLIGGEAWERSVSRTEARMAATCTRCEYFGACPGYAIGDDNREYEDAVDADGRPRCVVERGVLAHMERRLAEAEAAGLIAPAHWERAEPARPEIA